MKRYLIVVIVVNVANPIKNPSPNGSFMAVDGIGWRFPTLKYIKHVKQLHLAWDQATPLAMSSAKVKKLLDYEPPWGKESWCNSAKV